MARIDTREIPQGQWQKFLDDFSERHRNWKTMVEVLGADLGDQPEAEGAPLQGIHYESSGSEAGDIEVALGDNPDSFQLHRIEKPQYVRVAETQPGKQIDVEIGSGEGTRTLVRLERYPGLPGE